MHLMREQNTMVLNILLTDDLRDQHFHLYRVELFAEEHDW